jgi:uncharacterized protein involved in exopolysaccharide biosynthesis
MHSADPASAEFSPLQAMRRQRWPMFWAFVVVVALTIAYLVVAPKGYTSEARLFVRLGRESVTLDPTATTGKVIDLQESREVEINSVFELIKSRAVMEQVVDTLGTDMILRRDPDASSSALGDLVSQFNIFAPYDLRDEAIRVLNKNVKAEVVKKSNIIKISCDAHSPELARDIVATLVSRARETHGRVNRTAGSHEFFITQTAQMGEKLRGLEEELRDLKTSSGISSLDNQRTGHLRMIQDLQDRLLVAQSALASADAEAEMRRTTLRGLPEAIIVGQSVGLPNTAEARLRESLYTLQVKEKELLSKYTDKFPEVIHMRAQIAEVQSLLEESPEAPQVTHGVNEAHQEVKLAMFKQTASAAALKAEATSLTAHLATARDELKQINEHELQMVRLQRQIDLETANYMKYAENLEQARIDQELANERISNLNLSQEPSYSITPTRPVPSRTLAMGLLAAVAASIGVGLLRDHMQGGKTNQISVGSESAQTRPDKLPGVEGVPALSMG